MTTILSLIIFLCGSTRQDCGIVDHVNEIEFYYYFDPNHKVIRDSVWVYFWNLDNDGETYLVDLHKIEQNHFDYPFFDIYRNKWRYTYIQKIDNINITRIIYANIYKKTQGYDYKHFRSKYMEVRRRLTGRIF